MESNLMPIDIHLSKLLDWLIDRRQCPRDWQKAILSIRAKIKGSIQDMPEQEEIIELLSGSSIHYFNCLRIVEILRETEKNSKNIFGMYSSQRMKDWSNIVSLYQKNNIYLAEAASILQRNVAYEIPALKKHINKCRQQQKECEDKCTSQNKSVNEINFQIKEFCAELEIQGANILKELREIPTQIIQINSECTKLCQNLEKAYNFYIDYIEYFQKRKQANSLQILGHIIKHGNTTVYEWRTGVAPKQIVKQETISFLPEEHSDDKSDTIQFEAIETNTEGLADSKQEAEDDIDWGDIGESDAIIEICDSNDFNIEELRKDICVEDTGVYVPTDGIAKENDAYTLIEFLETRSMLINDLNKLDSFLKQKYAEMKSESDNILISSILQDAPKNIQSITEKDIKCFIELVKKLHDYFKMKKVEKIFRIYDSPKYLKRLYDQFILKQKSIDRCHHNKEMLQLKLKEQQVEETDLENKLNLIIKKTKDLQRLVCSDMSTKYNGVRINIMGELNMM